VSIDSGATWAPTSAPYKLWNSLAMSADGTKLVGGAMIDRLYSAAISATNWNQSQPSSTNWTVAASADGTRFAAAANPGPLLLSADSGVTWTPSTAPGLGWVAVASSADGNTLVAADFSQIYLSLDVGATWTNTPAPSVNWRAMASSADGTKLVAVANNGGIYTWQSTPAPVVNISSSGRNILLSWTVPSMDFALHENSDLTSTNWTDVPTTPALSFTNLQYQTMVSRTNTSLFYRLKH
jgi:hypothetical protein